MLLPKLLARTCALLACVTFGHAAPARADLMWGINGHPVVSYPGVSIETQLDLVKDLGMKSYRVDLYSTDQMDALAKLIAAGKARGVEILPILIPHLDLEKLSEDEIHKQAYAMAETFVARFKDDVSVWELGNEMEIFALIHPCEMRDDGTQYPCEWGMPGGVGPLDYYGPRYVKVAAALRGLTEGARAASPTVRRAIGTAGWGHLGIFERLDNDGIQWEITVWHMYGEDPEEPFKTLVEYGKPIWVTEFNHPNGSQKSEKEQAEGLRRTMLRLRELSGPYKVEAAHIYELLDETYWAPNFEAYMGLVRLDARPQGGWMLGKTKPAYSAVKKTISTGAPR
ncbi:glycosyl hydrolase [Aquabacter sp. CN5-332]|uniref:glycosyl hydrolase n=1 Tax=Aquabacter sp. CN5-332 TaxID=3156608 RepID=UPI0032B58426